jgi:hypothetical protein
MKGICFIKRNIDWSSYPILTEFEIQYGVKGTHIPTEKPRTYIGLKGEIMIDDEVSRDKPYAKIGDGATSFDGLDYLKVVKDYYNN